MNYFSIFLVILSIQAIEIYSFLPSSTTPTTPSSLRNGVTPSKAITGRSPTIPTNQLQDVQAKIAEILRLVQDESRKVSEIQTKLDKISDRFLPKVLLEEDFSNAQRWTAHWRTFQDEKFIKYKNFEGVRGSVLKTKPETGSYCVYSQIPEYRISGQSLEIKFSAKIPKGHSNSAYIQLNGCDPQGKDIGWDNHLLRFGPSFGGGYGQSIYFSLNGVTNSENFLKIVQNGAKDDGISHEYTLILDPKGGGGFRILLDGRQVTSGQVALNNGIRFCKVSLCTINESPSAVEIDNILLDTDTC